MPTLDIFIFYKNQQTKKNKMSDFLLLQHINFTSPFNSTFFFFSTKRFLKGRNVKKDIKISDHLHVRLQFRSSVSTEEKELGFFSQTKPFFEQFYIQPKFHVVLSSWQDVSNKVPCPFHS